MKLKDIGTIVTGNTPSKKNNEYYESNDILFVKPSDIEENYITSIEKSEEYISEKAREKARILPEGAVLVTCIGTIGKVGILKQEATCNQQINAIIPNDKVISKYLAYLIQSRQKILQLKANAPVVPIINKTDFSEIEINICDIEQQKQIVRQLDLLKSIIDKRKVQIDELQNIVKSQFVELFGSPFCNEKWEIKKIGNMAEIISDGNNIETKYYQETGDVLFLRIQNVWRNEFRLEDSVYVSKEVNDMYLDTSLHTGDILISKIGRYYTKDSSLGRVSLYRGENDKANYSNNIMRIRLKPEYNSEFVNIVLNLEDYQQHIRRESKGGTDKRALSKKIIENFEIINPPIKLQNEYVEKVKLIDKQKFESEIELRKIQKNIFYKWGR